MVYESFDVFGRNRCRVGGWWRDQFYSSSHELVRIKIFVSLFGSGLIKHDPEYLRDLCHCLSLLCLHINTRSKLQHAFLLAAQVFFVYPAGFLVTILVCRILSPVIFFFFHQKILQRNQSISRRFLDSSEVHHVYMLNLRKIQVFSMETVPRSPGETNPFANRWIALKGSLFKNIILHGCEFRCKNYQVRNRVHILIEPLMQCFLFREDLPPKVKYHLLFYTIDLYMYATNCYLYITNFLLI